MERIELVFGDVSHERHDRYSRVARSETAMAVASKQFAVIAAHRELRGTYAVQHKASTATSVIWPALEAKYAHVRAETLFVGAGLAT